MPRSSEFLLKRYLFCVQGNTFCIVCYQLSCSMCTALWIGVANIFCAYQVCSLAQVLKIPILAHSWISLMLSLGDRGQTHLKINSMAFMGAVEIKLGASHCHFLRRIYCCAHATGRESDTLHHRHTLSCYTDSLDSLWDPSTSIWHWQGKPGFALPLKWLLQSLLLDSSLPPLPPPTSPSHAIGSKASLLPPGALRRLILDFCSSM